jgi:hypothetical protein
MPWRVDMEPQRRIIRVAYEGSVTSAEIRACVERVIELMGSEQTSRVLMELDGAAQIDLSTVDIVNLPAVYRSLGLLGTFRQAIVVSPQAPSFDQAAFYETVCVNRGHAVRIFADRERALDWLGT